MSKIISICLLSSIFLFGTYGYNGSTTSAVTLVGGVIRAQHVENIKKYNRKDCPVCKGKGWYLSGDKIKKVECGYCEPPKETAPPTQEPKPICDKDGCKTQAIRR